MKRRMEVEVEKMRARSLIKWLGSGIQAFRYCRCESQSLLKPIVT